MISNTEQMAIFGPIYTINPSNSKAEAIIIDNGIISFVGSADEVKQKISSLNPSMKTIKLKRNQILLPGFIDSHMHPVVSGLQYFGCKLEGLTTIKQVQAKISAYIKEHPDLTWVFCSGYDDTQFPNNKPHLKYLDEVNNQIPISVLRYDGHAYLINSKGMEAIEVDDSTKCPDGGVIDRDENNHLNGVFHEASAMNLVRKGFPKRTIQGLEAGFDKAVELMVAAGITGFNDSATKPYLYNVYKKVYSERPEYLPRCNLSIFWNKLLSEQFENEENKDKSLSEIVDIPQTDKLKVRTVKIFVDGVLDSKTALLETPYSDNEENNKDYHGEQIYSVEELNKMTTLLHLKGIQCHYHAVGDKAIRISLDAIEQAQEHEKKLFSEEKVEKLVEDPRHYLAHAHIMQDNDVGRFKKLNIMVNFSPFWCYADSSVHLCNTCLGPQRDKMQYRLRDVIDTGAKYCFGSDWPVTTYEPLLAIEVGVTRKMLGDSNPKNLAWLPEQRMTVEEAVWGYTMGSAMAHHIENEVGSIEVGKKADLIVLNNNIFECKQHNIHKIKVLMNMVEGKILLDKLN